MGKPKDMTGLRFGRLTALRVAKLDERNRRFWLCQCDCGNTVVVFGTNLRNGDTTSCGCRKEETMHEFKTRFIKHGMRHSREYASWQSMMTRCTNPNRKQFKDWGGRGITVCEDWKSFEKFFADMGERPFGTSLDRIDNEGNYCKENCRWATPKEQRSNVRPATSIEFEGKVQSLSQWSHELGINKTALAYRINSWGIVRALSTPLRHYNKV